MSRFEPRSLAAAVGSSLVLLLAACAPELPVGRFACSEDSDCPEGWACAANGSGERRCYPEGTDFGSLHGRGRDAGEDASTAPEEAGPPPGGESDASQQADPPAKPPAAGRGGAAAPPAAGSGEAPTAGTAGSTPQAGAPAPPVSSGDCKEEAPDPAHGVFVSPGGITSDSCGTSAEPCSTIAQGMTRAQASKRELVYLDSGTYDEPVVLRAGLHLQGGFSNTSGKWLRVCSADRAERARISSPTEVGVWAEFDGTAWLDTLTVETLAQAPLNHSMYGVFARGTRTRLQLRDVRVLAASGGDGTQGKAGSQPAPRSGFCEVADDGSAGATAGSPGGGAMPGTFNDLGYVAANGMTGGTGASGKNGVAGGSNCRACLDACNTSTCSGNVIGQSCGTAGLSGCGGIGGPGGGGGTGGGSSFAIFAWGARVEVEGGLLQPGNGGIGAAGGAPAEGGLGSAGQSGTPGESCVVCSKSIGGPIIPPPPVDTTAKANSAAASDTTDVIGRPVPIDGGIIAPVCIASKASGLGTAGGSGGVGAPGGVGGGGAGGHSYGAFAAAEGRVDLSPSTLVRIRKPGKSLGNGASGEAADLKVVH